MRKIYKYDYKTSYRINAHNYYDGYIVQENIIQGHHDQILLQVLELANDIPETVIQNDAYQEYYSKVEMEPRDFVMAKKLSNIISEIKGSYETRKSNIGELNIDRVVEKQILITQINKKNAKISADSGFTIPYKKRNTDYYNVFDKKFQSNQLKIVLLVDGTGSTLGSDPIIIKNKDGKTIRTYDTLNHFFRNLCMITKEALKNHTDSIEFEIWFFNAHELKNYTHKSGEATVHIRKLKDKITNDQINLLYPLYRSRLGIHHSVVSHLLRELKKEEEKKVFYIFLTDGYPEYMSIGVNNLISELGKNLTFSYNQNVDFFLFLALTKYAVRDKKVDEIKRELVKIARNKIYFNQEINEFSDFENIFLRKLAEFCQKLNET